MKVGELRPCPASTLIGKPRSAAGRYGLEPDKARPSRKYRVKARPSRKYRVKARPRRKYRVEARPRRKYLFFVIFGNYFLLFLGRGLRPREIGCFGCEGGTAPF